MDKAKLGSTYFFIDLNDQWTQFIINHKINNMDQMDRYYFATKNWAYNYSDIEENAFDILERLTHLNHEEIAIIILNSSY